MTLATGNGNTGNTNGQRNGSRNNGNKNGNKNGKPDDITTPNVKWKHEWITNIVPSIIIN